MKRDLDLIRSLLITIEISEPSFRIPREEQDVMRRTPEGQKELAHIEMLKDMGYIYYNPMMGLMYWGVTITPEGYDYLACIRDDDIWAQTKEHIEKNGEDAPTEMVSAIAAAIFKKRFEDRTGLKL